MADTTEYKNVMKKLEQQLNDVTVVREKAEARDKEIDSYYGNLITGVFKFRQAINERLDELQKQIIGEADTKKTIDKQIIRTVLGTCTSVCSDITKLQSSLKNNKTSKQNEQVNESIKEANSVFKSNSVKNAEELLEKTDKQYVFEANTDLQNTLEDPHVFGKLNLFSLVVTPKKKRIFGKIDQQADITVRTKSDKADCDIKGCDVLSSGKLVLADWANKKIKVLDTEGKVIADEKELEALPSDIAVLPVDKIAVTLPSKRVVLLMSTVGNLEVVQTISIRGECTGITYLPDFIFVVCRSPKFVYILDTQGNVQKTITLDTDLFSEPVCIVVSQDSRFMYISDFENNCVVSVTLEGETAAIYKHKDFAKPRGMFMLDDGSLLVCCWNGTIHHLSGDLKQGQKITGGMKHLRSICYNQHHNVFYVGSWTDQLKVLKT